MRFKFILAEKDNHSVTALCRVMQVALSGYYAWTRRPESARAKADHLLRAKVRASHAASRRTYGSPRVRADLKAEGFSVGRNKVARLMREEGLQGCAKKGFRKTTDSNHDLAIAPNTLDRKFKVAAPNAAWVTDITYVWTWEGWMYLAVVVDLFSRRVVGWAVAEHMRTELVTGALQMALGRRCPGDGLLHHSDRGSQYASGDYRQQLRDNGKHGELMGLAADIFTFVTERADLRAWRTLPASWQGARAFVAPGEPVRLAVGVQGGAYLELGTYQLTPGETMFVIARSLNGRVYAHAIGGEPVPAP